jgi:transcriptional regulator of heat shock response
MSNTIFIRRLEQLNRLAQIWISSDRNTKAKEKLAQQLIEQYLATKRSKLENHLAWSEEQRIDYNNREFDAIFNWVTVDPVTELAKEGIKHLENNELDKLRKILDELADEKKLTSKIKSGIRKSKKIPEHPLNALIAKELQNNPTIDLPKLTKRLRALEGKSAITQWDNEEDVSENYIYSKYPDGKEAPKAKVTGLKERYYEVRNKK